ncbi:serine carboxypeptidase-like 1 isoform X2 [Fagus crenata]
MCGLQWGLDSQLCHGGSKTLTSHSDRHMMASKPQALNLTTDLSSSLRSQCRRQHEGLQRKKARKTDRALSIPTNFGETSMVPTVRPQADYKCITKLLSRVVLIVLLLKLNIVASQSTIETLPGFPGTLPFKLETE